MDQKIILDRSIHSTVCPAHASDAAPDFPLALGVVSGENAVVAIEHSIRHRTVVHEPLRDSTHWDLVRPRPDDIIIVSCYKSGTTLTQQIVNLLIHGVREFDAMRNLSPWIDSTLHFPGPEAVDALPSPRFLKSHLSFDALPYHPEWKYIYLVRDGRDVCLSLFDHCKDLQKALKLDRHGRPLDHGPDDFSAFWDDWVETGRPRWDYFSNIDSWWKARHLPNVLLLHYAHLVQDKSTHARRIASFLGRPWNDDVDEMVKRYSSLEHMKKMEMAGQFGGPGVKDEARFINKGINGRWQGLLSERQIERYDALLRERLEPDCADWIQLRECREKECP